MYADDISIVLSTISQHELETEANVALSFLEKWFARNNLRLNISKTTINHYFTDWIQKDLLF